MICSSESWVFSLLSTFRESNVFTEREKAALSYAEAVTFSDQQPEEPHFEALRRYFDDDAIIELTGLIAFQNMSSKFNASLGVEPQGFCNIALKKDRGIHNGG